MQTAEVIDAALQLPKDERLALASELIGSVGIEPYTVSDEEVQQRLDEIKSGSIQGLTWEEVKASCGRAE